MKIQSVKVVVRLDNSRYYLNLYFIVDLKKGNKEINIGMEVNRALFSFLLWDITSYFSLIFTFSFFTSKIFYYQKCQFAEI